MKLLYLDDSGSVTDTKQQYVVLGGVCVAETGVRWLSYELEKIAQEMDPVSPSNVELHASDIFSGKVIPWSNIDKKQDRVDIIKRVLHVLDGAFDSTSIFAVAIHKASCYRTDPMLVAYERISQLFNNHLEMDCNNKENGIIILDNTSYETGLLNLAQEIRKTGNRIGNQNRSIVEIPLFVDSKVSRIIQLADHIAYAVFRRYEASDLNYYNVIENRFILKDGIVHSLYHRPSPNQNCTCPACITRKK